MLFVLALNVMGKQAKTQEAVAHAQRALQLLGFLLANLKPRETFKSFFVPSKVSTGCKPQGKRQPQERLDRSLPLGDRCPLVADCDLRLLVPNKSQIKP